MDTKQIKTAEDLQAWYKEETGRHPYGNNCLLYLVWLENKLITTLHPVPDASQPAAVPDEAGEVYAKCKLCSGNGYTAEHDLHPHENGDCNGMCPIQVQCENCSGTGFVLAASQPAREVYVWVEKFIDKGELPEYDQKVIGKCSRGIWHDLIYKDLCNSNSKPRFMENKDSRPQFFSDIVSWLSLHTSQPAGK